MEMMEEVGRQAGRERRSVEHLSYWLGDKENDKETARPIRKKGAHGPLTSPLPFSRWMSSIRLA